VLGPQLEHSIGPFEVHPQPAPDGKLHEMRARAAVQLPGPPSSRLAGHRHCAAVNEPSALELPAVPAPLHAVTSTLMT
jgi:hypothetical protein